MRVVGTLAPMARRRVVRFILIPAAVLGAFILAAGVWAWNAGRQAHEVSEGAAVEGFRERGRAPADGAGPAPGVYTYLQSGREEGALGPASISRNLPSEARYVITPVDGGYEEELALAKEHVEAVRFAPVAGGGRRAVWRRTDITFVGVGRDDRRDLVPPPVDRPADLAVGDEWTARYRAGDLPVVARSRVLRRETVDVGGRTVSALVIRTVGDTGGVHPGRRVDTVWWSPRWQLPLRWTIDMKVRGVARITTRTDLRLRSLTPRV